MIKNVSTYLGFVGFAFALLFTGPAMAEECYRGTLDDQYCDRNRDPIVTALVGNAVYR